jgi:hypothetical protein
MYKNSNKDEFLIGLNRHLIIAQDTTLKKEQRLQSLLNLGEVLEYCVVQENESDILVRFLGYLLLKVKRATVSIHTKPETFNEEISFISLLMRI